MGNLSEREADRLIVDQERADAGLCRCWDDGWPGIVRRPGGGWIPCPDCGGRGYVDTAELETKER